MLRTQACSILHSSVPSRRPSSNRHSSCLHSFIIPMDYKSVNDHLKFESRAGHPTLLWCSQLRQEHLLSKYTVKIRKKNIRSIQISIKRNEKQRLVADSSPPLHQQALSPIRPNITASERQLSVMHPIYRLLLPHFSYTKELLSTVVSSFSLGMYFMLLSSYEMVKKDVSSLILKI